MPYFTGPNRAAMIPNSASAPNRVGMECAQKPPTESAAAPISASFSHCATRALS